MKFKIALLIILSMVAANIYPNTAHAITAEHKELNIPYICQIQDLPANTMGLGDPEYGYVKFGNYACGPTSTTMVLAYYNLLPPARNDYEKMVNSSFSSYGYYVAPDIPFSTSVMTYDKSRFVYSSPNAKKDVYGVWGQTQSNGLEPNGTQYYGAYRPYIEQLLQRNGLLCEIINNGNVETDSFKRTVKSAIDNKYAIIWHVTGGKNHYLVCRGYYETNDQIYYIINDPYPRNGQRQDGVQLRFSEVPIQGQSNDYIMIIKPDNDFNCDKLTINPSTYNTELNKNLPIAITTNYSIDSIYGSFIDSQGYQYSNQFFRPVSDYVWQTDFTFNKPGIWKIELDINKGSVSCKKSITVNVAANNECANCKFDVISQYEDNSIMTIPVPIGGIVKSGSVIFHGKTVNCPERFMAVFEVAPVTDVNFTNPKSSLSTSTNNEVSATFTNLAYGQYHWRARILKPDNTPCSEWIYYGNNANGTPDFIIGNSPCDMNTSSIPSQIACISLVDYPVDLNGYNPQNCTITVTSDKTDVIIARNSTKQNTFGRFFVYIESVNICGTANVTISVSGCVNCTKTITISVTGQCCDSNSELFVDPVNATMCVGDKKQFYIKSTTGLSFTDEHWSSNSPCLSEVQGSPGMFEAVCAGGPFQVMASVMTNTGLKEVKPANVTVIANPSVMITPSDMTIINCDPVQFIATTNPSGIPVTWSVEPSSIGTITNNGLFTPARNNGIVSGVIIAKVGTGNCSGKASANITIKCQNSSLIIEPNNNCNPFQLKAFLEPGHIPCNPVWKMDCQPSDLATIDAATGWVTPRRNAKGTCTITATYNNLQATTTITFDCPIDCIDLWIPRPIPLMPTGNDNLLANQICKCIPYQFKAYCTKSDYTGPHDVTAEGQWSIVPPVAGVTIDSNGKLISAVTGTFIVEFRRNGKTAYYSITVVDCNYCPPIGIYFPCDLVFIIGNPFPILPILYRADGSTVIQDPNKPFKYVIGDPSVIVQQDNENKFVGLKVGKTTLDVYYENLHTKTVVIINPMPNDNCANGTIIAPPSSPIPIDPMLRPIPSYWYYKCCPIVFSSVFRDRNGRLIDCSLSRWDVFPLDATNNGSYIMNNGSFVANRSGWYIIIVNCCDLTLVICIFIVDVYCPSIDCRWVSKTPLIIDVGQSAKIDAQLVDQYGRDCCRLGYKYEIIGPKYVTDPVNGTVTGLAPGTTQVRVSCGDNSTIVTIIVNQNCKIVFDRPSIYKDFSDKCCPDGDLTNNTPLDRFVEIVNVTKSNDSLVTIYSKAFWLKTEPTSFTEKNRQIKVFIDPKYFAKGSGGTCNLIFKCEDNDVILPVTIKTKGEIFATVKAFQLQQKVLQAASPTLRQELTDSEILKQLQLALGSYRTASSCDSSFDMIQKYGIIPFQMWLNKGTVPDGDEGNRTFLPLRFFADVGCLNVSWDNNKKEATIEGYGRKIIIGLKEERTIRLAFMSGSSQPTPDPQESKSVKGLVRIINGRVMVGARFVFKEFGASIALKDDHKTVEIIFRPGWDYPTCITQMLVNPNSIMVDLISGPKTN